ncbi:uncharacterized protein [Chlorocebus sabaeus]|uniref:uncharacterized protein n=1 Tax=Chlorocebus sabaeus TaxID=60711 RepID=UPI0018B05616|nr:uncharacterized protein LOC119628067 [Chlorocebus sabaeus]
MCCVPVESWALRCRLQGRARCDPCCQLTFLGQQTLKQPRITKGALGTPWDAKPPTPSAKDSRDWLPGCTAQRDPQSAQLQRGPERAPTRRLHRKPTKTTRHETFRSLQPRAPGPESLAGGAGPAVRLLRAAWTEACVLFHRGGNRDPGKIKEGRNPGPPLASRGREMEAKAE